MQAGRALCDEVGVRDRRPPDPYQTVSLSGAVVNLEYCGIEGAIAVLKGQYVVGTVTAKIIIPKPEL